ncbi:ankyrin repeat-containing domain protein [Schizophyllum amplum]|uniref:Ankyrin repeat-containing domain protein n=1 Tax=Schizophyllum amplum TaxID=97359 RepID=A0A550BXN2_9AGAR|nr:ankyrin repeat-containing domain protein [Auriculariopsis ampla]
MNGHPEVFRLLIDRRACVDIRGVRGRTPLHMAAYYCMEAVVRLLIDLGCDVNARTNDGETPLDVIGGWSKAPEDLSLRERIEHMLLQAGAAGSSARLAETEIESGTEAEGLEIESGVEGAVGEGGGNGAAET